MTASRSQRGPAPAPAAARRSAALRAPDSRSSAPGVRGALADLAVPRVWILAAVIGAASAFAVTATVLFVLSLDAYLAQLTLHAVSHR